MHLSNPSFRPLPRAVLIVAGSLLLVACGAGRSGNDAQVAVKVNKGEISVHQVQAVLQRQPRQVANDRTETASARVLEVLIDQELAAQAARDQGMDNDPRVVQATEAARRELLAHAYQERVSEKAAGPSSDEIDRYYDAQPALFAQRKLYLLQETTIDPAARPERVQAFVELAKSPEELIAALREANIRHASRSLAQAAEDIPLNLLEPVAKLEPGRSTLVNAPGAPRIYTVLYAHKAPIDRRTAANAIGTFLTNERRQQLLAQKMKQLRQDATIEYRGNFAKTQAAAASSPAAADAR